MNSLEITQKQTNLIIRSIRELQGDLRYSVFSSGTQRLNQTPNFPGVYILYERGAMVYIGRTKNIKNRLNSKSHNAYKNGMTISWLLVDNPNFRHTIEQALIYCFRPIYNIQVPIFFYIGNEVDKLMGYK